MRRSAGFGLNLLSLPPIPSHFSEHVSVSTLFEGRGIKLTDGLPATDSGAL
jgi:hypothetical protein